MPRPAETERSFPAASPSERCSAQLESLLDSLAEQQYAIVDEFWPAELVHGLYQRALALENTGAYQLASLGNVLKNRVTQYRNDRISWIDPVSSSEKAFARGIDDIIHALNQSFYLGLVDWEAHYACFPPGARYRKHLDAFRTNNRRMVTIITYLNPSWNCTDGGALRLYLPSGPLDIFPAPGKVVVFFSEAFYHEVLPAITSRYSLTGWLLRPALF